MRVLLDTHVWLWMLTQPERLGQHQQVLSDAGTDLLLSAVSSWEIAIKHALGRLPLPEPPASYVPSRMRSTGVLGLSVEHSHALEVAVLPPHHRDPFDRLLVAQARLEDVPILTADRAIGLYDVDTMLVDG